MSADETRARFEALNPQPTIEPRQRGIWIEPNQRWYATKHRRGPMVWLRRWQRWLHGGNLFIGNTCRRTDR